MDIGLTNSLTPATNYIYNEIYKVNPFIMLIVAFIIIFYFFVFKYLGRNATVTNLPSRPSKGITLLEIIMWGVLIFLVLTNSLKYFFGLDITVTIKNLFTSIPEIDIDVEQELEDMIKPPIPKIERIKQVFHIPANKYTYDDAKAVCKAYDAELATYDQVANAYNNNAEWCSYGWSKDQLVLYPTQEKTYNKLQKIKGHENDCGRPGINGGFISNSNARFGVNCYGHKPEITPEEQQMMINRSPYPLTKEDKLLEKRVECYRKKLKNIIVSPFNNNQWSKI